MKTTNKSDLLEFYEQVLATGNMEPDDNGFILGYSLDRDTSTNLTMGIKRNKLALPYPSILRNTQDIAIFHPLQENVLEGLTPVMKKLIGVYEVIFNMKIVKMMLELVKFGSDVELQNNLTGREGIRTLLSKLVRLSIRKASVPVSETNFENIKARLEYVVKTNSSSFITLNIRRAGFADGKKWSRAGVVSFPFYTTLQEEVEKDKSNLGTRKEIRIMKSILEYIFKDINNPGLYCGGSNDTSAPSLMALLNTVFKIANDFNGVIDDLNGIVDISNLRIPTAWDESLDNGEKFIAEARKIPSTSENRGSVNKKEQMVNSTAIDTSAIESAGLEKMAEPEPIPRAEEQTIKPPVIPQQAMMPPLPPPVMQAPIVPPYNPPAPQQSNKEDGISVNDLLGFQPQPVVYPPHMQPPVVPQQPMMYPATQPGMYPQPVGYPQQQMFPQQVGNVPVLW